VAVPTEQDGAAFLDLRDGCRSRGPSKRVTGTKWQGTGVMPDVAVPDGQAYD